MKRWLAIHTKPKQECIAEENLTRQYFEIYQPRIKLARRRRGKWRDVIEPLFPRYLFIRLEFGKDDISPIRSTTGVVNIVQFGGQLASVPDELVDSLKVREDPASGLYLINEPIFKKGDEIIVQRGAFSGVKGIFEAVSGEERVIILLNLMGKSHRIKISRDDLVLA